MQRKTFITLFALLIANFTKAQVLIYAAAAMIGAVTMSEHGYLPGKKFKFYPTINKYDFNGMKLRVELFDDRDTLKLQKTTCSQLEFTNTSEFADPQCIFKVRSYLDTLIRQAGGRIDSSSTDTLRVRFEAIDARLIGFGAIRVHGLCQMKMKYHSIENRYCVDITDAHPHSPISPNAFVTRQTATRIMASASMREVIEMFFVDLQSYNETIKAKK
ncbi:MAG: hypothetical protein ACXVC6_05400 [Bacteroidia bacterium]